MILLDYYHCLVKNGFYENKKGLMSPYEFKLYSFLQMLTLVIFHSSVFQLCFLLSKKYLQHDFNKEMM